MDFNFPGWRLIGAFPDGVPDDVGSWLLVNGTVGLLLEVPPGLSVAAVKRDLAAAGVELRFVTASHDHEDHLDVEAWEALHAAFPRTTFLHPSTIKGDHRLDLDGEPVWLVKAPKHSLTDVVTVFRGVAMTGDIELGIIESVNDEVTKQIKKKSMARLQSFQERADYHVHTIVSAHLNDLRVGVNWPDLFSLA